MLLYNCVEIETRCWNGDFQKKKVQEKNALKNSNQDQKSY